MFTLVNMFSHLYHRIYRLTRCRRPKQKPKQQASYPFQHRPPPGSPITVPPRGERMSTCAFGFRTYSWSSLPSNLQGALPGPPDGCGTPNTSSFQELIGASPPSTPDKIPSTTPGAEPPRDARDSGSARSHSMHLETSSSDRP